MAGKNYEGGLKEYSFSIKPGDSSGYFGNNKPFYGFARPKEESYIPGLDKWPSLQNTFTHYDDAALTPYRSVDIQASPDMSTANIVQKTCDSNGIAPTEINEVAGDSTISYVVAKGDTLGKIAAAKGLTTEQLLDRNQWLVDQGRVSSDGRYILIKPGEKLDLAGITFVSKYESDGIRAMYGDAAFDSSDLSVVPTAIYNDWKRSQLVANFNFFGQNALQGVADLNIYKDMQSTLDGMKFDLFGTGLNASQIAGFSPALYQTSASSYRLSGWDSQAYSSPSYSLFESSIDSYDLYRTGTSYSDAYSNVLGDQNYWDNFENSFFNGLNYGSDYWSSSTNSGSYAGSGGSSGGYYDYGDDGSGGSGSGGGDSSSCPIGIDLGNDSQALAKDALGLKSMFSSTAFFDMDGDTYKERTGWVGPDDGLLVIDLGADGVAGGDGKIDQAKELSFKLWSTQATTDLDGLRLAFDTNNDGVFDAGDARFSEFRVWQDQNQDGVCDPGELKTLAEVGLSSIALPAPSASGDYSVWTDANHNGVQDPGEVTGTGPTVAQDIDGNTLFREAAITWASGDHTGKAYDLGLKYSTAGLKWDAVAGGYKINAKGSDAPIMVRVVEQGATVDMDMAADGYDVVYASSGAGGMAWAA